MHVQQRGLSIYQIEQGSGRHRTLFRLRSVHRANKKWRCGDSVGNDSYNLSLSERRAQAAGDALVQRGIDRARIASRGFGKSHPVADNGSPEGRAMNRRVEIVIADEQGNLRGR